MKIGLRRIALLGMLTIAQFTLANGALGAGENEAGRKANHLLGVESPYLQQHVYNVVNWYPWGTEALDRAKIEGKPIFLSIGYSTCHWCHVMARESFEDEKIGNYLNDNFISIKIDRERRPDLDEQFMLVTQVISGGGGWPNSVFLTADGKPFFAGTYFPPDAFMDVLKQVNGLWKAQNNDVRAEGERIASIIQNYMNRTQAAKSLTPEAVQGAAKSLMAQMDEFNGGFGVAPKFPQESSLLFMFDSATRNADREMLDAVLRALDGMIKGGIQDHVGGGFHRYSVDAEWDVPHFEKMLYNQALIGRLLIKAWEATGEPRYKRTAIRTFDYVIREMTDKNGGFHSAQDADSLDSKGEKGEGNFYIWTPEQFVEILGDDAEFAKKALSVVSDGNFEGANVLRFSELPAIAAEEENSNEQDYLARLDVVFNKLYQARKLRAAPHQDEKIVVSWNAMMIETLAQASKSFSRPDYYLAAKNAMKYILDEMLHEDELKRVSFEGNVGVEAQLPDYAGLGTALLSLYDFAPIGEENSQYLTKAGEIAVVAMRRYANGGGAYKMSIVDEGLGRFIPYDDNEIPSGNALTLSLLSGLAKRTNEPLYAQKATLLAAALSGHILESPGASGYSLLSALNLSLGEIGSTRFIADGTVRISAVVDRKLSKVDLNIRIKEGWHVNANKPLEDYFVPTQLDIDGKPVDAKTYPKPDVKSLSFNDKPMALYEGDVSLSGTYQKPPEGKSGEVTLTLQACSDKICLLPEEVKVRLW